MPNTKTLHPHIFIKKKCEQMFHGKYVIHDKDAIYNTMASIIESYEVHKHKVKSLEAWVLGAIHHHYCDYLFRKERQKLFLQIDDFLESGPTEKIVANHDMNIIKEEVLKLEKPYVDIVLKKLFEGKTHKEIAEELHMNEVTVRKYYSRSIPRIKRLFGMPNGTLLMILIVLL